MLKLNNIFKSYDEKIILDNINLEILDKEFLVLVGPSGSGKSTLMRIIAGLDKEFSGDLIYNEQNISRFSAKERDVSMVFQNYALYPHMTVAQNIAFPLKIKNYKKSLIQEKTLQIARKLSIEELLKRKPYQLSGGQRQRVALARALIKEPRIFLLDEPLSNLDAKLRVQLRQEIFKIKSISEATFVYVTHDQLEALTLGDRIAVLNNGQVQQVGTAVELFKNPANTFVASFIGNPPMNLLDLDSQPYIIGFRAEDVSLDAQQNSFKLSVDLVNIENLGNELLFYCQNEQNKNHSFITLKLPFQDLANKIFQDYINKKRKPDEFIKLDLFIKENLLYYFNKQDGSILSN